MKIVIFVSFIFISAFASDQNAKNTIQGVREIGNGGDAVLCDGKNIEYQGIYVLDYFLSGTFPQNATQDKLTKIIKTLEEKLPTLGSELKSFSSSYMKKEETPYDSLVFWKSSKRGLLNIHDEDMIELLPQNCSIKQIIRRIPRATGITFYYDEASMTALEKSNQLSWIIVHEYLWSRSTNAIDIREANEYLHSIDFLEDEDTKALSILDKLQINVSNVKAASVIKEEKRIYETTLLEANDYLQKTLPFIDELEFFLINYKKNDIEKASIYNARVRIILDELNRIKAPKVGILKTWLSLLCMNLNNTEVGLEPIEPFSMIETIRSEIYAVYLEALLLKLTS